MPIDDEYNSIKKNFNNIFVFEKNGTLKKMLRIRFKGNYIFLQDPVGSRIKIVVGDEASEKNALEWLTRYLTRVSNVLLSLL